MVKVVTNTSPLIHLYRAGEIDLLNKIYPEIWTSNYIYDNEILFPEDLILFKEKYIKKKQPDSSKLEEIINLFGKKIEYGEITCAALYKSGDYVELLMANNDAESAFINLGIIVRNFLELAYIAIKKELFDENLAREYMKKATKEYKLSKRVIEKFKQEGFWFLVENL